MKRVAIALIVATGLAGCGADGAPIPPSRNSTIFLTESGVSASTGVVKRKEPASQAVAI